MSSLRNITFDELLSTYVGQIELLQQLINNNNRFTLDQVKKIYAKSLLNIQMFKDIIFNDNITDIRKYNQVKNIYKYFKDADIDNILKWLKSLFDFNELDNGFLYYILYLQRENMSAASDKNINEELEQKFKSCPDICRPVAFLRLNEYGLDERVFFDFVINVIDNSHSNIHLVKHREGNILYELITFLGDDKYHEILYKNSLVYFEGYTDIGIMRIDTKEIQLVKNHNYNIESEVAWVKTENMRQRLNNGSVRKYMSISHDKYELYQLTPYPTYTDEDLIFLDKH